VHLFSTTVDGTRRAYPLGNLADLLSFGGRTTNIVDAMRQSPGGRYRELGNEYWAWAKDQFVEKDVLFDGALANPCVPERDLIGRPDKLTHPQASEIVGHFEQPLQTKWVVIKFRNAVNRATILPRPRGRCPLLRHPVRRNRALRPPRQQVAQHRRGVPGLGVRGVIGGVEQPRC
jgi:hypothetical protein